VNHPNATTAAGTGGAGVFVAWLLGHLGISLSAEDGAVIATAGIAVALFIGRNGVLGAWRRIWRGTTATLLLLTIALTFAGTSAGKPRPHAAVPATAVVLAVTAPGSYHVDRAPGALTILYVLTHRCWAGGVVVENAYIALPWFTDADVSANLGPFPASGEFCEAFVWAWPDSVTAASNVVTYDSG